MGVSAQACQGRSSFRDGEGWHAGSACVGGTGAGPALHRGPAVTAGLLQGGAAPTPSPPSALVTSHRHSQSPGSSQSHVNSLLVGTQAP